MSSDDEFFPREMNYTKKMQFLVVFSKNSLWVDNQRQFNWLALEILPHNGFTSNIGRFRELMCVEYFLRKSVGVNILITLECLVL